MNFLKNILARFWALWGLMIFIITMLVVVWPILFTFLIPDPKGVELFRRISNVWMRCFLFLIGCSIKIVGKKNFQKGKVYIIVSNHNSLIDIPLTTPFIPGPNKTIAKTTFANIPFFGWIYRRGSVLVNRKNVESRKKSIDTMKNTLASNVNMCIYPEGTRNRSTEALKPFYDGAFKLAFDTKKDIIPCLLFNTKKVLPVHKFFYVWPHTLEIHFLQEILVNTYNSAELLKQDVYNIMKEYYDLHQNELT